jgi:hypothetical protein
VLGAQTFVSKYLPANKTDRNTPTPPARPLPAITNWGGEVTTLHGLRKNTF